MMTTDRRHVMVAAITGGYLIYDGIILFCYVKSFDALGLQTLIHHFIGTSGLFIGVMAGWGTPSIGNMSVMSEISTIFLNYRSMFGKEQMQEVLPQINQVIFFITYTIFRMFLYPYGTYILIKIQYYGWPYTTQFKKNCLWVTIVEYLAMFALNVYWYKLIVVGLLKMIGIMESKP